MMQSLITAPEGDKQSTRICSEIAIREWPQKWPELTQLLTNEPPAVSPLHLIRTFAEIQVNGQFFYQNWNDFLHILRLKDSVVA